MTEYGLTQYALANAIGVQPTRLGQIVAGKRNHVGHRIAARALLWPDAQSWLNWQAHYDLQVAQ